MRWNTIRTISAVAGALLTVSLAGPMAPASAEVTGVGPLPAPSASCSTSPTGGSVERTLVHEGESRPYRLFVPSGLTGPAPLIVAVHGGQSSPSIFEPQTGWNSFAESNKVIVAYPRGSKSEGVGKWAWEFARNVGPDVSFLRKVVHDVAASYCVLPKRVHFAGHSNGGQMTSRMACDAADLIASAAVWAGPKGAWDLADCPASRKIAFGVMLNDNDPVVWQWIAEQHRDHWRQMNNCGTEHGETGPGVLTGQRFDCAAGTSVIYRLYDGPDDVSQAHVWPSGARGTDVRARMWSLFTANPLP